MKVLITGTSHGIGKVIKVEGDIITVDFESVGVKKLLGNQFKLKKKD